MGVFSDSKIKDGFNRLIPLLEKAVDEFEAVRQAQDSLNKRFTYIEELVKLALGKKK